MRRIVATGAALAALGIAGCMPRVKYYSPAGAECIRECNQLAATVALNPLTWPLQLVIPYGGTRMVVVPPLRNCLASCPDIVVDPPEAEEAPIVAEQVEPMDRDQWLTKMRAEMEADMSNRPATVNCKDGYCVEER